MSGGLNLGAHPSVLGTNLWRSSRSAHAEGSRTASCKASFIVTAQVGDLVQDRRRDFAKDVGSQVRASMMAQPCFLAVEKNERMSAKSTAPSTERKPPEIFWRNFIMRPSRCDDERPRLGQIEHLPGAVADARVRIQARAAPGAGRRVMIDHDGGIGDLPQRLAFVALLPARFLAGPVPQARHPRRLLQPITRRRLAAVRTVQPEPALKLRQPRLQRRILGLQGRDQREKVVHRWRTRRRFASHPMLESEPVSSVERIFSPNPAVAQPGQLPSLKRRQQVLKPRSSPDMSNAEAFVLAAAGAASTRPSLARERRFGRGLGPGQRHRMGRLRT